MSNGLLAEWRRGIVARGLTGALLLSVPVAVAAVIGFGSSFSGVVGGLTEIATGPDNAPSSQAGPTRLSRAAAALAAAPTGAGADTPGTRGGNNTGGGVVGGGGTGGGGGSTGGGNNGGSPNTPAVNPPTVGVNDTGISDTVNGITDSVGNLLPGNGH